MTDLKMLLAEDLRKWVQQRWVDIGAPKKGGGYKPCGRSKGEKRKGYPKCVPAAKAAGMSKKQKKSAVRRKRAAGNPGGKPTMVSTYKKKSSKKEAVELFGQIISEKLCARGKSAAKRKFDVYPSAYANMYASAVCSGKVTPGGKKGKKNESGEGIGVRPGDKTPTSGIPKGGKPITAEERAKALRDDQSKEAKARRLAAAQRIADRRNKNKIP